MKNSDKRGMEREKNLASEAYFSDEYFATQQLFSFALQIKHIHSLKPSNILEIGPGNGFVSTFLRRAGYSVTTVDINPALKPDICAPLSDLPQYLEKQVDLVVCCEVLEHMPFSEFQTNLDILAGAGRRLFMTLPSVFLTVGLGVMLTAPKISGKMLDFNIKFPKKRNLENSPHFWEVGSSRECSQQCIENELRKRYSNVSSGRFNMNPYHIFFIGE